MLRLLINSLAKEFYQQHAGFFLVGIYILFGMVGPSQLIDYQKSLLSSAVSSPVGLVMVFTSWLLYSVKVHFFIKQKLGLTEYNFIKEIGVLDRNTQLKLWLTLYFVLLLPIIIYVLALICLGVYNHFFINVIYILFVFSALVFGLSFFSYQSVTFGFLKQERQQINSSVNIKRPSFSWPLYYLFNEQSLMLLICKILSLVFFKCVLWMFADIGNDTRVLLVALLASVLCHVVLIFTLLKFEIAYLNFNRSLPISIYKRLHRWLMIFSVILIPEWVLLIISSDYNLYSITNGFLFGLAGLFFLLILLYIVKLNMENYLKWLLFFFFTSMWSVVAHYYLLFSLVLLGCCALYYLRNFDKTDLKTVE
jgi:hypothetical protein